MPSKKPHTGRTKNEGALTTLQLRFCVLVAAGSGMREAYMEASNMTEPYRASQKATELMRKAKIKEYIAELVREQYSGVILERKERIRILSHIALTGTTAEVLKAIDQLNRIDGSYSQKVEVGMTAHIKYQSLEDYYADINAQKS